MGFKFGGKATKTIELSNGESIEVRTEVSRGIRNKFVPYMPQRQVDKAEDITPTEGIQMQQGLFLALIVGWTAVDENGKPLPPTAENYDLMTDGIEELDEALANHFASLFPTEEEEGKPETSRSK